MSRIRKRISGMAASRRMSASDWGGGENEHYTSSGPLSWYFAQPEAPGLTYALTMNGYLILS